LQGFFKFFESPHPQAAHSAEESEIPDPSMDIVLVKNGQTLLARESGLLKGPNQSGQFGLREPGPGQDRERTQIQQGVVESAFPARHRQGLEGLLARLKIEVFVRVEAHELAGADDVQFYGHGAPRVWDENVFI
jgi:hypothetical protein